MSTPCPEAIAAAIKWMPPMEGESHAVAISNRHRAKLAELIQAAIDEAWEPLVAEVDSARAQRDAAKAEIAELKRIQVIHLQNIHSVQDACSEVNRIRDRLVDERDEWKACAERTDAKMLHEQADHNKTVDRLIAAKAEMVALREALGLLMAAHDNPGPSIEDAAMSKASHVMARTSADFAHLVTVDRDKLKELEALALVFGWRTGVPTVPAGKMRRFWCCAKASPLDQPTVRLLCYGNGYVMPRCDDCGPPPAGAVAIEGDEENFAWTGWWEDWCEQCDTFWLFHGEVLQWIQLPNMAKFPEAAP